MKYCILNALLFTLWVIILFTLITPNAHASPIEIGVITNSKHFDTDTNYNESNPGLYIIHNHLTLGAYKNSYAAPTAYAGRISVWKPYKRVKLSLAYGVSYGYGWDNGLADPKEHGARPLLFVLPTLSIQRGDYYLNTHIVGNAVAWSISREW